MSAPSLSLVQSKSTLTEKEVLKKYADYLMGQSWCIDVSAYPVKAHAVIHIVDPPKRSWRPGKVFTFKDLKRHL
jgi:hypothetical protein